MNMNPLQYSLLYGNNSLFAGAALEDDNHRYTHTHAYIPGLVRDIVPPIIATHTHAYTYTLILTGTLTLTLAL